MAEPGNRSGTGAQSVLHHLGRDNSSRTVDEVAHPDVGIVLERWVSVHDDLRAKEETLADAVRAYAQGTGPVPLELLAEVTQLRALCGGQFSVLLESV